MNNRQFATEVNEPQSAISGVSFLLARSSLVQNICSPVLCFSVSTISLFGDLFLEYRRFSSFKLTEFGRFIVLTDTTIARQFRQGCKLHPMDALVFPSLLGSPKGVRSTGLTISLDCDSAWERKFRPITCLNVQLHSSKIGRPK